MSKKELLFSITANDCKFTPYKGSGAGGQKRNKTSSAIRCEHLASGAIGECEEHREQTLNKKEAFKRMYNTEKFQKWLELEIKIRSGELAIIEAKVDKIMKNVKVEIKEDGKWVDASNKTLMVE